MRAGLDDAGRKGKQSEPAYKTASLGSLRRDADLWPGLPLPFGFLPCSLRLSVFLASRFPPPLPLSFSLVGKGEDQSGADGQGALWWSALIIVGSSHAGWVVIYHLFTCSSWGARSMIGALAWLTAETKKQQLISNLVQLL